TGGGLALAAGLNAYVPLLLVALLARFTSLVALPQQWAWLTGDVALVVLAVLLLVEVVADKVPSVDHVNDLLQTVVRPTAGGIVFAAGSTARTPSVSHPADLLRVRSSCRSSSAWCSPWPPTWPRPRCWPG